MGFGEKKRSGVPPLCSQMRRAPQRSRKRPHTTKSGDLVFLAIPEEKSELRPGSASPARPRKCHDVHRTPAVERGQVVVAVLVATSRASRPEQGPAVVRTGAILHRSVENGGMQILHRCVENGAPRGEGARPCFTGELRFSYMQNGTPGRPAEQGPVSCFYTYLCTKLRALSGSGRGWFFTYLCKE